MSVTLNEGLAEAPPLDRPVAGLSRRLLLADGLAMFGNWIDFLAILMLAAYQQQVSASFMALLSATLVLPGMLVSPWLGRCCDRGWAGLGLLASLLGRTVLTLALIALIAQPSWAWLLALAAGRSVLGAMTAPAVQVLAVQLTPTEQRNAFYAQLSMVGSAAKVLAPLIGAGLASRFGEATALWASVACALVAAAVLWPVLWAVRQRGAEPSNGIAPGPQSESALAPARLSSLLPLLSLAAGFAAAVFMAGNLLPLVLQRQGLDKALLGSLVASGGVGNLLAGLLISRSGLAARLRGHEGEVLVPMLAQMFCFGLFAAVLLAAPPSQWVWLLPAAFFCSGLCSASFAITLNIYMSQRHGHAMGQATAAMQTAQQMMVLLAPLAGAWVLDRHGGAALFAAAALMGTSWALLHASTGLVARRRRGLAGPARVAPLSAAPPPPP
ncbi:MFS transporter [Roseateles sp.]|jgi:MFS family permease|uniref:MFS transporter n=1 Tax=Roseateles sp. TaxID=1971397 RepID=UPI0037C60385